MPKEWPDQARFLEILKTLKSASKAKLAELVELGLKNPRAYYKHAAAILVKQVQVKRPRQRVPILYVVNSLCTADDKEVGRLYAGRFAPEIVQCVKSALKCPPQYIQGLRKVLDRWQKRRTFQTSVTNTIAELVRGYDGGESASAISEGALEREASADEELDDYVVSSDDEEAAPADHDKSAPAAQAPAPAAFRPPLEIKSRVNRWPQRPPRKNVAEAPAEAPTTNGNSGGDETLWNPQPPPPAAAGGRAEGGGGARADGRPSSKPMPAGARQRSPPRQRTPPRQRSPPRGRSPPRRRSPPRERSPARQRSPIPQVNVGSEHARGRDRERARDNKRDNKRKRVRRPPQDYVERDKWGDPIRRDTAGGRGGGDSPPRKRSPLQRRSPPPRDKRSRSPVKVRSPIRSPARARSPAKERSRSRSPPKVRSPVRRRSPSPVKRRSPVKQRSPMKRRSPSPVKQRSPVKECSPSPVKQRSPKLTDGGKRDSTRAEGNAEATRATGTIDPEVMNFLGGADEDHDVGELTKEDEERLHGEGP